MPSSQVNRCVTVTELESLFVAQACLQPNIFYAYDAVELINFVKWYINSGSPLTEQEFSQWGWLFAKGQKIFPNKLLGALLVIIVPDAN